MQPVRLNFLMTDPPEPTPRKDKQADHPANIPRKAEQSALADSSVDTSMEAETLRA